MGLELSEFKAAFEKLGYPLTDEAAAKAFDGLDKNDGGMVLFGEFTRYMASVVSPKAVDFEDNGLKQSPHSKHAALAAVGQVPWASGRVFVSLFVLFAFFLLHSVRLCVVTVLTRCLFKAVCVCVCFCVRV